jgi:hypothetical protein
MDATSQLAGVAGIGLPAGAAAAGDHPRRGRRRRFPCGREAAASAGRCCRFGRPHGPDRACRRRQRACRAGGTGGRGRRSGGPERGLGGHRCPRPDCHRPTGGFVAGAGRRGRHVVPRPGCGAGRRHWLGSSGRSDIGSRARTGMAGRGGRRNRGRLLPADIRRRGDAGAHPRDHRLTTRSVVDRRWLRRPVCCSTRSGRWRHPLRQRRRGTCSGGQPSRAGRSELSRWFACSPAVCGTRFGSKTWSVVRRGPRPAPPECSPSGRPRSRLDGVPSIARVGQVAAVATSFLWAITVVAHLPRALRGIPRSGGSEAAPHDGPPSRS